MTYDVAVKPFDRSEYYSPLPLLTGSLFVPPPASGFFATPLSVIVADPGSPFTLKFSSPPVPPAGVSALLIKEAASGGDVLRSGPLTTLPDSPAAPNVFTIPPVLIPTAMLTTSASRFSLPPTVVPYAIRLVSGLLTLGTSIPLVVSLPPPTITLGDGTITITAAGALAIRRLYFAVRTLPFTLKATFTLAPSGDPTDRSRVLKVNALATTIDGGVGIGLLVPFLVIPFTSILESLINATIVSTAASAATKLGKALVPSAAICAHKITVFASSLPSGGGINLQLVLSDLFGMPIIALPKDLNVSISPTPVQGTVNTYTVIVTDAVTGAPIQGATVSLHNFSATGAASNKGAITDGAGRAVFHKISLYSKIITREVDIPPTLIVTAALYASDTLTLL